MEDQNIDNQNNAQPNKITAKRNPVSKRIYLFIAIGLLLIMISGFSGYYLRDQSAKTEEANNKNVIAKLSSEKKELNSQLESLRAKIQTSGDTNNSSESDMTNENYPSSIPSTICNSTPNSNVNATTIENIKAAITTSNTAALEGYMAQSVCFSLAASDGIGTLSAKDATRTFEGYMPTGDTWTFTPTTQELASYKSGQYSNFFVEGVIIAKSSTNQMFVISFDNQGKINIILRSSTQNELMY